MQIREALEVFGWISDYSRPGSIRPSADANTTERSSTIATIDNTKVEVWLDKKETYEVRFKEVKEICFMSIDKAHIATILELSTPKKMFNALDHNYSARIAACLRQLLHDCQATSK